MVLPLQSVTDPPMQGGYEHAEKIVLSHTCRVKSSISYMLDIRIFGVLYVVTPIQQICWRIARAV